MVSLKKTGKQAVPWDTPRKGWKNMIEVCAITISDLPSTDELLSALPPSLRLPWEKQHTSLRREEQKRQSLGCLYLLAQRAPLGTLSYESHGRPCFTDIPVTFSLSHNEQLAVCAVCKSDDGAKPSPIGVDVESLSRVCEIDFERLCRRYATGAEQQAYLAVPSPEHFLRLWTRKEAMLKQSGLGLCGLHVADTESDGLPVQFSEYHVGDNLISLCAPKECSTPDTVLMLK